LLKANRDLLSQLDSATGDGDHGVTMCRVADAILDSTEPGAAPTVQALLESVGWSVLSVDGGSASPLVGSFLLGMSEGCPSAARLNTEELATVFEAGLAKFRAQTSAQVGDKTMLDALVPAVDALRVAVSEGLGSEQILARAAEAARLGAESTKSLQAKFGRARNLGPRSVGFADPGATSIALLFTGFHAAFAAGK
jgi:phosphoenolpyruvate---glycerone phosphotransferase subunit DhaL